MDTSIKARLGGARARRHSRTGLHRMPPRPALTRPDPAAGPACRLPACPCCPQVDDLLQSKSVDPKLAQSLAKSISLADRDGDGRLTVEVRGVGCMAWRGGGGARGSPPAAKCVRSRLPASPPQSRPPPTRLPNPTHAPTHAPTHPPTHSPTQELLQVFASEMSAKSKAARRKRWLIGVTAFSLVLLAANAGLVSGLAGPPGDSACRPTPARAHRSTWAPPSDSPCPPTCPPGADRGRGRSVQGHGRRQQRHGRLSSGACVGWRVRGAACSHPRPALSPRDCVLQPIPLPTLSHTPGPQVSAGTNTPVATAQAAKGLWLGGGLDAVLAQQADLRALEVRRQPAGKGCWRMGRLVVGQPSSWQAAAGGGQAVGRQPKAAYGWSPLRHSAALDLSARCAARPPALQRVSFETDSGNHTFRVCGTSGESLSGGSPAGPRQGCLSACCETASSVGASSVRTA